MSIEENFNKLDDIVAILENKDTPLEDAFTYYEQGVKLVKECSVLLENVEKKIIVLQGNEEEA